MTAKGIVELRRVGITESGTKVGDLGRFWYRLKALNGKILADSELINGRRDAERIIQKYFGEPQWKFKNKAGD